VQDQDVDLLDACGDLRRHAYFDIGGAQQGRERAAIPAGERDDAQSGLLRGFDGAQDARRVAAGTDGEQHIPRSAQRQHLAGEHVLVTVVVGDRGHG